jgi:hypothetical protein
MIKRIVGQDIQHVPAPSQDWLNLDVLVQVEVTSEDAAHPIESSLLPGNYAGWRAAESGPQTVRLLNEDEFERTQQFVLRWSSNGGASYLEIVRQQYNFSPPGTTSECEDYHLDLVGLTALELNIIPDISGGAARASLAQLNLA